MKEITILKEKDLPENVNVDKIKNNIIWGDALTTMRRLPNNSVKLIITSPSYEVGKEYENHLNFDDYLNFKKQIIK